MALLSRFLRWLFKAEGLEIAVGPIDWGLLAGMGSGAEAGLEAAGIENYEKAVDVCKELDTRHAASGAPYGLDDLVCFLCLSQHAEVIHAQEFPRPAPPVLVSAVLGLKDPAPASGGLAVRMSRKTPPARRLSRNTPIMFWVLPELLASAHIGTSRSVCQCCRAFHSRGLFMAGRMAQARRNLEDLVEPFLSLKAPVAAAVLRAGLQKQVAARACFCVGLA